MAASSADKDYVHRVASHFQDKYGQVDYEELIRYIQQRAYTVEHEGLQGSQEIK